MIEVQSLSRFYGTHQAVKDVSFSISANEVIGFLGLNGAGKSTTLKVIAGLLPPSSGTVIVDGVDVSTAPTSFRARIGYLPEEPPLYKEMTVTEYLRFLGGLRGMASAQITARLDVTTNAEVASALLEKGVLRLGGLATLGGDDLGSFGRLLGHDVKSNKYLVGTR